MDERGFLASFLEGRFQDGGANYERGRWEEVRIFASKVSSFPNAWAPCQMSVDLILIFKLLQEFQWVER